jgi:hypothetical protein
MLLQVCNMTRDAVLYNLGKNAIMLLAKNRQRGTYHAVRDPDGVVTLWASEGEERGPFRITFANRGRISGDIEDMAPEFVRAFVDYVQKTVLKR